KYLGFAGAESSSTPAHLTCFPWHCKFYPLAPLLEADTPACFGPRSGPRSAPPARPAPSPGRGTRRGGSSGAAFPPSFPSPSRARSASPAPSGGAGGVARGGPCSFCPPFLRLRRGDRPDLHQVGDLLDLPAHEEDVGQDDLLALVGHAD